MAEENRRPSKAYADERAEVNPVYGDLAMIQPKSGPDSSTGTNNPKVASDNSSWHLAGQMNESEISEHMAMGGPQEDGMRSDLDIEGNGGAGLSESNRERQAYTARSGGAHVNDERHNAEHGWEAEDQPARDTITQGYNPYDYPSRHETQRGMPNLDEEGAMYYSTTRDGPTAPIPGAPVQPQIVPDAPGTTKDWKQRLDRAYHSDDNAPEVGDLSGEITTDEGYHKGKPQ